MGSQIVRVKKLLRGGYASDQMNATFPEAHWYAGEDECSSLAHELRHRSHVFVETLVRPGPDAKSVRCLRFSEPRI